MRLMGSVVLVLNSWRNCKVNCTFTYIRKFYNSNTVRIFYVNFAVIIKLKQNYSGSIHQSFCNLRLGLRYKRFNRKTQTSSSNTLQLILENPKMFSGQKGSMVCLVYCSVLGLSQSYLPVGRALKTSNRSTQKGSRSDAQTTTTDFF
ncbi:hypothetical protein XENOCAPTIV_026117 [Xenoophorus captivus]|uniref:Uncharacterized protein n=1 Tax=Xenoophorus captivus TaxID=1517983 RepID=A0ABV0RBI4_9TELE